MSKAVDALRDKVARRRAAYERAKREAQEVSAAEMSQLKTYSRARRKVWRDTFDRIVDRRRLLVRDTLSLYRLAPIPAPVTTRADLTDSRVAGYHIGGTAVPSILQFKGKCCHRDQSEKCLRSCTEQSMPAAIAAMELIARLVYMLAQYLGIRLPHRIQLPSSARPTTSLTHGTRHETYSLRHDRDDISAFAMACAMLVVDVHHLASMQQLSLDAEEHDLGRMLLSIGKAPALGQVSDEAARTPVREQDRPKTLSVRRLAARIVEEHHVNEQWETVNLASLSNSGELERSGSELVAGPHLVEDNNQLSVKGHMPIVPAGVASTSTAG